MVNATAVHLSPLERLPTEILEIIFFDCLNLSLPRASLILGSTLSSFHVKAHLFEIAFSFDRCVSYKLSYIERLKDLFRHAAHWENEVSELQCEILRAKWVKADFFRRYIPIYLERTISALSEGNELPIFVHRPVLVTNQDEVPKRVVEKRACPIPSSFIDRQKVLARLFRKQIKLLDVTLLFSDHMPVQIHLADPGEWISTWVDSDGLPIMKDSDRVFGWKRLDDAYRTYCERDSEVRSMLQCNWAIIPTKFLGGPWTKDQCHIVAMLSEAGALISTEDPTDCEIAMQGFFHALKDRNLQIVRYLLGSLQVGPEYLVYAVLYLDCPKAICESLIRRGKWHWHNIHFRVLQFWAERKAAEGNYRGWWLLDTMCRYSGQNTADMDHYIYIPPEDPNFSPGSFELINPALMVDVTTGSYKSVPWWAEWLSLELASSSLGSNQHDGPLQKLEYSPESLEMVSLSVESDQNGDPPQALDSSLPESLEMVPPELENDQPDDPLQELHSLPEHDEAEILEAWKMNNWHLLF